MHAGKSYIDPELIGALVDGYRSRAEEDDESSELTARQLEVLRLVADGLTSQKVADQLGLSVRTVDRHIENIMNRLNIHSRIELVKYAIREGWSKSGIRPRPACPRQTTRPPTPLPGCPLPASTQRFCAPLASSIWLMAKPTWTTT